MEKNKYANAKFPSDSSLQRAPKIVRDYFRKLLMDCSDMQNSRTSFIRCRNCYHVHDENLVCYFCGWDNSTGEMNPGMLQAIAER